MIPKRGGHKVNHICAKHNYSSKNGGLCPICRQPLKCMGDRMRIGHCGQFDKVERKTRKLAGQIKVTSWRARSRNMAQYKESMIAFGLVPRPIQSDLPSKYR